MFEKKKLMINTEICDARTIVEEDYAKYENIMINTELLLVNERAKSVLARLPVTLNAEETIALPEDMCVEVRTVNGKTKIGPESSFAENTLLAVNGRLEILPGAQEAIEKCYKIMVNGSVLLPESMSFALGRISVNGASKVYPDGAVVLESDFSMDRFFPLRARQDAVYFAANRIVIADMEMDAQKLAAKNVSFITKELVVPENMIETLAPLVDIGTSLTVVPDGYALVNGSCTLDDMLIRKYGKKLFILGDLEIPAGSAQIIGEIEKLQATGCVTITRPDLPAFEKIGAEYKEMKTVRGKFVGNAPSVTVDQRLLDSAPDGVTVGNAAIVRIDAAIAPETILEKMEISNAAMVCCTPEQRGAVELVTGNVAHISTGEEGESDGPGGVGSILGGVFGGVKAMLDTKLVNTENHVL